MQTIGAGTQKPTVSSRLFRGTFLNFAGQGYLLLLTFATAPYIVHHLGAELFAVVALVQSTAGFAGVLNLGIGRALTKYVSELFWRGDTKTINELFQTAWATCIGTGIIGLACILGPKETISRLILHGGTETDSVAGLAIYVAAFGLFSSMLMEGVSGLPVALQRFGLCNGVNVVIGTLRSLGSVLLLALGFSVRSVLIVNLLANLVGVAAFAHISRMLIPGLTLVPRFTWRSFRKLFDFSFPLFLAAVSGLIVTRLDRFLLAYFLPITAVTFYTLPYSLSEKLAMGVSNVTSVVFPFTSELHARAAHEKVRDLYLRSTKILTLLTLPLTVILMTLSGPILRLWLGAEFARQGAVTLSLLAAATFLGALSAIPTVTSLGVGRAWMPANFALAGSIISMVANLSLIPRYGINGAAAAALLPQVLLVPIFILTVNRILGLSLRRLFSDSLLGAFGCAATQLVAIILLRRYAVTSRNLILICATSLCLFGVLAIVGALRREERNAILEGVGLRSRFNPVLISGQQVLTKNTTPLSAVEN